MAKKKTTENIKDAPVLRAQSGGGQPTPTPGQTGTRTYQIMDPWKDRGVVNLVDVKSVDGEITDVKVNGEPAGGGGGGDLVVLHPYIVEVEQTARLTLDKTWNELKALFDAKKDVLIITKNEEEPYPNIIGMQYMFKYEDRYAYTATFKDASGDQETYSCNDTNKRPYIVI